MSAANGDGSTSFPVSTNILVLSNILYPVIEQLEKSNKKNVPSDLRTLFYDLEEKYPGFGRYFVQSFIEKEIPQLSRSTSLNALTLKLEQFCDKTPYLLSSASANDDLQRFNMQAQNLKQILSYIPDSIDEKRIFLERIKDIASAIKKILDSVSNVYQHISSSDGRRVVELEKKEFIRVSKNFSDCLKTYFRDNQRDDVFVAANNLLVQTDYLLRSVKIFTEKDSLDALLYPLHTQYQEQMKRINAGRSSVLSQSSQRPDSSYDRKKP